MVRTGTRPAADVFPHQFRLSLTETVTTPLSAPDVEGPLALRPQSILASSKLAVNAIRYMYLLQVQNDFVVII